MSYAQTLIGITGLNIILALSVWLSFAVGQFSLAQVGFWAIGAYSAAMLTTLFGWALLPALLAAAALCAVIGVALGAPCLRIRGIYLALATLGFSEVVRVLLRSLTWQRRIDGVLTGPAGVLGFRNVVVLTTVFDILLALGAILLGLVWIGRSRLGLAMRAVRQDETAAEFMGIDAVLTKVSVFALSAAVAGIGGGLYANSASYITSDDFDFHRTLLSVLIVAIGGTETLAGPILGAAVLTLVPEYFRFLGDNRMIFYGVLVVVVTIWRPRGLVDRHTVRWFAALLRAPAGARGAARDA
jgi:branched-chain amino acid transport system permease protein